MNIDKYQCEVNRTRNNKIYINDELANYTLGLVCETGEVGDIIKKYLYHGHDLDYDKISEELGDVMWYLVNICNILGLDMQDILENNIWKLNRRYPRGFASEDSILRRDKDEI